MIREETSILLESSDIALSHFQNQSIFNFCHFPSNLQISERDDHLKNVEKIEQKSKILKNNFYFLDSSGIHLKHVQKSDFSIFHPKKLKSGDEGNDIHVSGAHHIIQTSQHLVINISGLAFRVQSRLAFSVQCQHLFSIQHLAFSVQCLAVSVQRLACIWRLAFSVQFQRLAFSQ